MFGRIFILYIVVRIFVSLEKSAGIEFPWVAFSFYGVAGYAGRDPIFPATLSVT
jgi:hypothetical protein